MKNNVRTNHVSNSTLEKWNELILPTYTEYYFSCTGKLLTKERVNPLYINTLNIKPYNPLCEEL